MWIKASDVLSENVFQLTTPLASNYLVVGDATALVDCGPAATADLLLDELKKYLGEETTLDFILLTHSHFDHIGGIPALRAVWPELEVFGAPQTAQHLSDEACKKELYEKNAACAAAIETGIELDEAQWCEALRIDRIIGDGDVLDIGEGVEIKLIACPGHTEDSVAYFVRPDDALLCGETIGSYRGRDMITNCFTHDYQEYLESLDKLSALDVKILGFPHGGAITGELVAKYFLDARSEAESFHKEVLERIENGELVDEIHASLLPDWQAQDISPEGPFVEEQGATLLAMIKAAAAAK